MRLSIFPAGAPAHLESLKLAAALILLTAPLHAEWLRFKTSQVELLTDSGDRNAQRVLDRLSQLRASVGQGARTDAGHFRIFLFSSESEFHQYAETSSTEGYYSGGRGEREYIVLHSGDGLTRVTAHEYVHSLLDHGKARYPRWLDEGMAEFYSTIEVTPRGVTIGSPIAAHQRVLAVAQLLNAKDLEEAGRDARRSPQLAGLFYAESWALTHMLTLSPKWKDGVPAFLLKLDDAILDLKSYLPLIRPATLPGVTESAKDPITRETLTPVTAAVLRGNLALQTKKLPLARALFESALKLNPDSPEAIAGLAELATAEGRREEAARLLKQALALRTPSAELFYDRAMQLRSDGAPKEQVETLLNQAIATDPSYGEAHFQLGLLEADSGELPTALDHLATATQILPRQSYIWHELAYAQMKAGLHEEAKESAEQAYRTAESPDQSTMARTLLEALM